MIPSNTFKVVGGATIRGIIERSDINPDASYVIEGFMLHELLVLANRIGNFRMDDANEKRDWENRLNGMVMGIRDMGPIT